VTVHAGACVCWVDEVEEVVFEGEEFAAGQGELNALPPTGLAKAAGVRPDFTGVTFMALVQCS
jgi:hypothetical protein